MSCLTWIAKVYLIPRVNGLDQKYEHILAMLNNMELKVDSFCFSPSQPHKRTASRSEK